MKHNCTGCLWFEPVSGSRYHCRYWEATFRINGVYSLKPCMHWEAVSE